MEPKVLHEISRQTEVSQMLNTHLSGLPGWKSLRMGIAIRV